MRRFLKILVLISFFIEGNAFGQAGIITTIAGRTDTSVRETDVYGWPATAVSIQTSLIKMGPDGTLYICEPYANYIRKITPTGIFLPFCGTGRDTTLGDGGPASSASIQGPDEIAFDSNGDMFICSAWGNRIRKVDMHTGIISTICGNGRAIDSGDGGPATLASINNPLVLWFDRYDNLYITTVGAHLRRIERSTGIIINYAGSGSTIESGDGGQATSAGLGDYLVGVAIDSNNKVYISNHARIRVIDPITHIITRYGGVDTMSLTYVGDGFPATATNMNPNDLQFDKHGNLFVAELNTYNRLLKIRASDHRVETVAGTGVRGHSGDGGPATNAQVTYTQGVTLDSCDNVYFSDNYYNLIRKVSYPQTGPLSVSISSSSSVDWLCYGMAITYTATLGNPLYEGHIEWSVNGVPTGPDARVFTYSPANGDTIRCRVYRRWVCDTTTPAYSNAIIMTVSGLPAPVITLPTGSVTAHVGDTVRLTASITGTAGSYEIHWRNRGSWFTTTTTPSVSYIKTAGNDTITATLVSTARTCYDSVTSNNKYIDSPVSIPEVTYYNEGTINCYPNPVRKNLTIESEQYWNQLEISDALGKIVYSTHLETPTKSHSLTTSDWVPGVYFLKIDRYRVIRVVKE